MVEKVPMTQGGFVKLQEELRFRQQEERPRIIEAIAEARAHGDLSENAEYHAAKEAQSHNEGRITELEDLTARAEVIDLSKMSGSKIKFGATVKLIDEDSDEEKTYQIVGDQEADVKAGRISISSPIARALIGKEVGDSIEVNAPGGAKGYGFSQFSGADWPDAMRLERAHRSLTNQPSAAETEAHLVPRQSERCAGTRAEFQAQALRRHLNHRSAHSGAEPAGAEGGHHRPRPAAASAACALP